MRSASMVFSLGCRGPDAFKRGRVGEAPDFDMRAHRESPQGEREGQGLPTGKVRKEKPEGGEREGRGLPIGKARKEKPEGGESEGRGLPAS